MCNCAHVVHISRCRILRYLAIRRNSFRLWGCLSSLLWMEGKWLVVWRSLSFVSEKQKGRGDKFDLPYLSLHVVFSSSSQKSVFGFLMLFCKEGEMAFGPFDPSSTGFHLKAEAAVCLLGCSAVLPVLNFRQVTWHWGFLPLPLGFFLCFCAGFHLNNNPFKAKTFPLCGSRWNILTVKWRTLICVWKSKKSVILRL